MNRRFKFIGALIFLLAALLFSLPAVHAADAIFCKNMAGTTAGAQLVTDYHYGAYVIIPGDNNSQVVVTSFSATSDDAADPTANAYIYDKEDSAVINSAAKAGSTELGIASGGANFDANDFIVLQDAAGNVYIETVASTGAGTIALNGFTDVAITATGWKVYEMSQIATIPVGNATLSYQSNVAVVAGTLDSPVMVFLGGDAACSINFASGHYR